MKKKEFKLPIIDDTSFRALIEKSSDVIVLIDKKTRILYASPSIIRLFGRKYDEFLGLSSFKFIHPIDIPKVIKILTSLVLRPKEIVSTELRVKPKKGDWIWLSATATNLFDNPKLKGIVVNFHDITAQKELEEKKDEFISIASHELKTPITSIKAYNYMLKKYLSKDEKAQVFLEKIEYQISRLTELINDLFDVSKIQEGKLELKKNNFQLYKLIKNIAEEMQLTTDKHKITLTGNTQITIFADEYRISQVLINLLSNAIKYSPKPGNIIVNIKEKDNNVIVSIKDAGLGIAKKDIPKIFERFYQTSQKIESKIRGLGLGLYICQTIIKLHRGEIWVKSERNKGSKFTFTLPKK